MWHYKLVRFCPFKVFFAMCSMEKEKAVPFFLDVLELKDIVRNLWVFSKVPGGESVAAHSFNVALLTFILGAERKLNLSKAIKMALIHDLHEAKTGDIIEDWKIDVLKIDPAVLGKGKHGVTAAEKSRLEQEGMDGLTRNLPAPLQNTLTGLWKEFEEQKTREALFVRSMDKLDLLLQAAAYEKKHGIDFSAVFAHPNNLAPLPEIKELQDYIKTLRKNTSAVADQ